MGVLVKIIEEHKVSLLLEEHVKNGQKKLHIATLLFKSKAFWHPHQVWNKIGMHWQKNGKDEFGKPRQVNMSKVRIEI